VPSQPENAAELAKLAVESSAEEFIKLVREVNCRLSAESGTIRSFQINGKLVEVPPSGTAIIVGDLHGDLQSLLHIIDDSKFLARAKTGGDTILIFLGDYGDRGPNSPEVYYVVLKLKQMFPENVILLRGNHEGPSDLLASPHDLPFQLNRKFGSKGQAAYMTLRELFSQLYTAVLVPERCVMLHGGVPSRAASVEDIAYAHEKHPQEPHLEEILWSDPWERIAGTVTSPRGAGRLFGEDVTHNFLEMLEVRALIRGHQPCPEGYSIMHGGRVLTLFSRKGPPYNNHSGAYLCFDVSKKLATLRPLLAGIRRF